MGLSEKTQHAIRRSTRLPLEVPVLVTSLDPAQPFSEPCNTTLVNAHGCGLIVPRALAHGMRVRLEIVSTKRHTTARVSEVVPLGGDPETWLVGLELDIPGNFWGIDYAPSDWRVDEQKVDGQKMDEQKVDEQKIDEPKLDEQKIEESPSSAAEPQRLDPEPTAAAKPVRSHRWRLTDISAGACYLDAAAPFPADTPVLLSIRVLDTECLLEGVVRVSHEQTGMGVEFTRAQGHDLRARVAELIGQLMDSHEVPRIFVGRKEGRQALTSPAPAAARDSESPDPLLELIRTGASLTVEQFQNALRAQRLAVK